VNETEREASAPLMDPKTGKPLAPISQPGYYPGYKTLTQKRWWDATTRQLIEKRVNEVPPLRFFTEKEIPIIRAICDRILPQDDRLPEVQIPVLNYIDKRLYENRIDGYQYEDMPSDREAYRLGIRAIEETAVTIHGSEFVKLDRLKQDFLLKSIRDGKKLAAHEIWKQLSIHHFWALLVGDCVQAYYSHPWAWDEIGYGGPAYPRAYMRLEGGKPEPWEVDEKRYEWTAPFDSISDSSAGEDAPQRTSHLGQKGSH
jgi:hypothetical protein